MTIMDSLSVRTVRGTAFARFPNVTDVTTSLLGPSRQEGKDGKIQWRRSK